MQYRTDWMNRRIKRRILNESDPIFMYPELVQAGIMAGTGLAALGGAAIGTAAGWMERRTQKNRERILAIQAELDKTKEETKGIKDEFQGVQNEVDEVKSDLAVVQNEIRKEENPITKTQLRQREVIAKQRNNFLIQKLNSLKKELADQKATEEKLKKEREAEAKLLAKKERMLKFQKAGMEGKQKKQQELKQRESDIKDMLRKISLLSNPVYQTYIDKIKLSKEEIGELEKLPMQVRNKIHAKKNQDDFNELMTIINGYIRNPKVVKPEEVKETRLLIAQKEFPKDLESRLLKRLDFLEQTIEKQSYNDFLNVAKQYSASIDSFNTSALDSLEDLRDKVSPKFRKQAQGTINNLIAKREKWDLENKKKYLTTDLEARYMLKPPQTPEEEREFVHSLSREYFAPGSQFSKLDPSKKLIQRADKQALLKAQNILAGKIDQKLGYAPKQKLLTTKKKSAVKSSAKPSSKKKVPSSKKKVEVKSKGKSRKNESVSDVIKYLLTEDYRY